MNKKVVLAAVAALAIGFGLLGHWQRSQAQAPSSTAQQEQHRLPELCRSTDDCYRGELLDILDQTRSVDSLVVTLRLLIDMKCDSRRVIPAAVQCGAIRHFRPEFAG
jgi:hypothetical protein